MRHLNPGSDRLHNGTSNVNRPENVRNRNWMTGLTSVVTLSKSEHFVTVLNVIGRDRDAVWESAQFRVEP